MSKYDIRTEDANYLDLYEYYVNMRNLHKSRKQIVAFLASEFKISESTVNRIIRRLSQEIII